MSRKYFQALFPFLCDMDAEKAAAWRHFDCLITTNKSVIGQAILGPTQLLFIGKRLATSFSKLKHPYTFHTKYEDIHDIQRNNNGFFYRNNIVLRIGQNQTVTLSFRRNRDAVHEEILLRCSSSKPILRPHLSLPVARPRSFAVSPLRVQSMACLSSAKLDSLPDTRRSLVMDFFPLAERRRSFKKSSLRNETTKKKEDYQPSLISLTQSFESVDVKSKEKERPKTFFLERRLPPAFTRSKTSLALCPEEKEQILFDAILPITSQKLLVLLFPDARPVATQRTKSKIQVDLPKRSLSLKKLLPRNRTEAANSPQHVFSLKVLGPEGAVYFSCQEERDIKQESLIRVETRTTLVSRSRPIQLAAHFLINPVSNTHCHLLVKASCLPLTCSIEYARAIIKARIPQHLVTPKLIILPCPIAFSELTPTYCKDPAPAPPPCEPTPPKKNSTALAVAGLLILYALLYLQNAALSDIEAKLSLHQP